MMDMAHLAERCEAAKGPDRRLDTLIAIASDPDKQWIVGEKPGWFPRDPIYGPLSSLWDWANDETKTPPEIVADRFTASIDAAMTLVPDGALVTMTGPAGKTYSVRVNEEVGLARSFALALCSAALRARAAE